MIFKGFERRHERLAPISVFIWRQVKFVCLGSAMIGGALLIGVAGYYWIAHLQFIDSILEASMILGGMGPVNADKLNTNEAKLFASAYALFSGLIFIGVMGVVLSPIMHRVMHKFHLDKTDQKQGDRDD